MWSVAYLGKYRVSKQRLKDPQNFLKREGRSTISKQEAQMSTGDSHEGISAANCESLYWEHYAWDVNFVLGIH